MYIESFEWDANNEHHIARHRVIPDEVEEVFEGPYFLMRGRDGRYIALGVSASGRYLFVVFEHRGSLGQVRVVTARDMVPWEQKLYRRKR